MQRFRLAYRLNCAQYIDPGCVEPNAEGREAMGAEGSAPCSPHPLHFRPERGCFPDSIAACCSDAVARCVRALNASHNLPESKTPHAVTERSRSAVTSRLLRLPNCSGRRSRGPGAPGLCTRRGVRLRQATLSDAGNLSRFRPQGTGNARGPIYSIHPYKLRRKFKSQRRPQMILFSPVAARLAVTVRR